MTRTLVFKAILAITLCVLSTLAAYGKDIYVDDDNTEGPWDGTRRHPYQYIQDGLDVALPGDIVWVAPGTYEENITLKSAVELLGAGAGVTEIRKSTGTVVTADAVNFKTKIDGFTINGMDKSGDSDYGIYCSGEAGVISNVTITNTGSHGIYCSWSNPTIGEIGEEESKVTITNTGAHGIYCYVSSPTISNVEITNAGYGICCYNSSSPVISDVKISNPAAFGIYCGSSSSPTVSNVTIDNTGADGIYCLGSSPTINNVRITGAIGKANGIYCLGGSNPKIRGSVIEHNGGNGIRIDGSSLPDLGTEADPGLNSICNNAYYDVLNENPTEVKAELNWWGYSEPPFSISGNVDYDPWLSIYGTVTDKSTGNPIESPIVIAINVDTKDKYKASTDSNGHYGIPDLPAGTYLVICIKPGYKASIKKVEVPTGDKVDFKLTPSLE